MVKRQQFTAEFKREAVRQMQIGNKPIAQLSRELGVPRNRLYKWSRTPFSISCCRPHRDFAPPCARKVIAMRTACRWSCQSLRISASNNGKGIGKGVENISSGTFRDPRHSNGNVLWSGPGFSDT